VIDALFQIDSGSDSPMKPFLKLRESILTSAANFHSEKLTVFISMLEKYGMRPPTMWRLSRLAARAILRDLTLDQSTFDSDDVNHTSFVLLIALLCFTENGS
jgi:hypothetical protein